MSLSGLLLLLAWNVGKLQLEMCLSFIDHLQRGQLEDHEAGAGIVLGVGEEADDERKKPIRKRRDEPTRKLLESERRT